MAREHGRDPLAANSGAGLMTLPSDHSRQAPPASNLRDAGSASAEGAATRSRILIVEDETSIAEVLQYNLEQQGFRIEICDRGDDALERIRAKPPDLMILDLMLPGLDGLDLLREVRRQQNTAGLPVLVLTAKGEEVDRIVGLELGADDYIPKPFSPRELVLRVKAILRRSDTSNRQASEVLQAGTIVLDGESHRLSVDGEEIRLTATEFRLLKVLMQRAGRVQTREMLLTDVWGYSENVDSRTVDTHIRRLRRKLGNEADRIETVIGFGYRFRG